MALRVSRSQVAPERTALQDTWRFVRRDGPAGIGVGVAAFKSLPEGREIDELCESHDVPEVHFVLSGEGELYENGERVPLRAEDAVVTPAGARHVLYATGPEPLVTVYVAVGAAAPRSAAG